jgi:hypothetical protein
MRAISDLHERTRNYSEQYIGRTQHGEVIYVEFDMSLCSLRTLCTSVAEPEPQGAASFGRSRSRNEIRLRFRLRLRQWYQTT